jgi:MGT family glycosyltransferase
MDNFGGLPKVEAWVDEQLATLEREASLAAWDSPDLSRELVVVFSTPALVGATAFPAHYHFVGPSISDRPDATAFPWEALDPARRKVFVSLGTISADRDRRFYDVVAEAVAGTPWQIVIVAPDGMMPSPPDNVIARPRVPQLALLPHMDAVVSHGGHNTVCETLAQGKPLVVTPIRDDQPVIADQVVKSGAGLRLHFGRLTPRGLRETIGRVLDEPAFAEAAGRVRASFAAAGGAPLAATLLVERLA